MPLPTERSAATPAPTATVTPTATVAPTVSQEDAQFFARAEALVQVYVSRPSCAKIMTRFEEELELAALDELETEEEKAVAQEYAVAHTVELWLRSAPLDAVPQTEQGLASAH